MREKPHRLEKWKYSTTRHENLQLMSEQWKNEMETGNSIKGKRPGSVQLLNILTKILNTFTV